MEQYQSNVNQNHSDLLFAQASTTSELLQSTIESDSLSVDSTSMHVYYKIRRFYK